MYKVAVQLLERFDPSNPALKKTQEPIREDVRHRRVQKREPGVHVCGVHRYGGVVFIAMGVWCS